MSASLTAVLLCAAGAAGAASQPASQPSLPGGGKGADATGQFTQILEVADGHLKVQESWSIVNASGKRIDRAEVELVLPGQTRRLSVDEDSKGFEGAETSDRVIATRDLGAGAHSLAFAYFLDLDGDTAVLDRTLPVNINGMRLILEDIDGVEVASNLKFARRTSELNGLNFAIYDFDPATAGMRLQLTVTGLPSHSLIPRRAATALVVLLFVGMVFGLVTQRSAAGPVGLGAMSAAARRDRIVKAIELLEADKADGDVADKAYARRHKALMTELSTVLRELDLEKARG